MAEAVAAVPVVAAVMDVVDGSCWTKPKESNEAANTSVNSQEQDQFTQNTQPLDEDSPFFFDSQEGKLEASHLALYCILRKRSY